MKRILGLALVAMGVFAACEPIDEGGGGGGGTGTFSKGFVFVRSDKNVYAADQSDYQTVIQLTTNANNKHPSLSSDAKRVVFVHTSGTDTSIMTVATAANSTVSTVLASDATKKNFKNPVFSPDNSKIAFAYDNGTTSFIGLVNADGSGFTALTSGTLSYGAPAFYPDGQAVIAAAGNSISSLNQIQKVTLTGTSSTVVTSLGDAVQINNRVVVSPDGTKAAFDGRSSSSTNRIFVLSLGAGTVTQLTEHQGDLGASDSFPTWTSNTDVAFSSDTGGADQVYIASTSSTKVAGTLTVPSALEPWYGPTPAF